jgi:hypothetical protein
LAYLWNQRYLYHYLRIDYHYHQPRHEEIITITTLESIGSNVFTIKSLELPAAEEFQLLFLEIALSIVHP